MKTARGSYTFTLRRDEHGNPIYQVRLFNGEVVPATWPDEGNALAGAEVEERRLDLKNRKGGRRASIR